VSAGAISVIVPVFNGAAYVGEALASIRAQTHAAAEIVVVDDGSRDDSAAVVQALGAAVRYQRQEHAGAGAARNHGVRLARGEWLAFLDADDLWAPEKLALQVQALAAAPALEAVFAHAENFHSPDLPPELRQRLACPPGAMPCTTPSAMLIRRAAFERVGGFDESGALGEVVDWYVRARAQDLVEAVLPQTLVRRRIHAHNTGRLRAAERGSYVRIAKAALERRRAVEKS